MQRWIALGAAALVLFLGGSYFGLNAYRQGRPHPIWVPLPLNVELDKENRDRACENLRVQMLDEKRVMSIVSDLKLASTWSLPSDKAAAAEFKKRMFVRTGRANTPMGEVPAIHVGINGTRKERIDTEKIVMRMMEDVKIILGLPEAGPKE